MKHALHLCWWYFLQMKRVKELRGMMMEADPSVAVSVRKMVMVSLMEVFKDIAPTYRIRPLTSAEKNTKVTRAQSVCLVFGAGFNSCCISVVLQVKKETQQLREFEEGLVSQYKFYLEDLEQTIKGTSLQHTRPHTHTLLTVCLHPQTGSRRRGNVVR